MSAPGPAMQLGRYELISPLGSGGMGLVWRARDVRLSRTVAIKFARERFSDRVEREARCIGALNHPNICTLYDVCEDYLVMELIDGKPLTGPLPIEEVLKYAIQIADALTAAHRQGIVHRDLKPTNILLTKAGVKLLDFGVAEQRNDRADLEATALDSTPTGAVIGTPLYMAPEQLAGKIADTRADIFAFGAVLHELITGKPAFEFRSSAGTIARFPTEHPQSASDAEVLASSALNNVVQTCLEKDPDDRWQSASELKHALTWIHTAHSRPRRNPPATRIRILYLLLLIPAFLGGFGIAFWLKPGYLEPPKIETVTYSGRDFAPAVSPDGRIVAFSSDRDGTPRIWLKQLDGGGEVALTSGSDDNPRFSPDGTSLLFSRNVGGRLSLYRVSSLGGDARKIIDDAVNGDFSPDGRHIGFIRWKIQMQDQRSVIGTAASDGSNAVEIASFPNTRLDRPRWSPDGSKIATVGSTAVQGGIYLETWVIGADGSGPRQLKAFGLNRGISSLDWADNRTLIYTRGDRGMPVDGQLIFHDIRKDLVTGTPWPCCALTVDASRGRVIFDEQATRSGLLKVGLEDDSEAWISRANSCDRQPVFSPDGNTIVFTSNRGGHMNLWQIRLDTGALSRLTEGDAVDSDPAFSPNGKQLIFDSDRSGVFEIYIANADGTGVRQITHDGVDAENPTMTADGRWLVYASADSTKLGVWKVHPDGTGAAQLIRGVLSNPELSPDGMYVAYVVSTQPDLIEIHVARVSDGSNVPFRILCHVRKQNNMTVGRVRWIASRPGNAPQSIAFVGQDERGATGVYVQRFIPGVDTENTRKQLRPFDFRMPVETLGVSPNGKTFIVSVADDTTSVMLASRVPGLNRVHPDR